MWVYLISLRKYEEHGYKNPVTYTSWLAFALPVSVVCLTVAWLWLTATHLGFRQVTSRFVFLFVFARVHHDVLQYGSVLVRGWSKLIAYFLVGSASRPAKGITVVRTEQAQKIGVKEVLQREYEQLGPMRSVFPAWQIHREYLITGKTSV